MKTIKKETKSFCEVFVAIDGTEFRTAEECKKYEQSAYCVVNERYMSIMSHSDREDCVFSGVGYDDHIVESVNIKTKEDGDIVLQMYFLINPHLQEDDNERFKKFRERACSLVQRALADNEPLLVGRNECDYHESFWIIGTPSSVKESIDAFVNEKKQDNAG